MRSLEPQQMPERSRPRTVTRATLLGQPADNRSVCPRSRISVRCEACNAAPCQRATTQIAAQLLRQR